MQGYSMQQLDYSTKTIFYERNDLVLFILSVMLMHGGNNTNIRCNQKCMFISAQHFWGFPLYCSALLGIPTLTPAGRKKVTFQRFHRH